MVKGVLQSPLCQHAFFLICLESGVFAADPCIRIENRDVLATLGVQKEEGELLFQAGGVKSPRLPYQTKPREARGEEKDIEEIYMVAHDKHRLAALTLVERFDIESYSNFSAK